MRRATVASSWCIARFCALAATLPAGAIASQLGDLTGLDNLAPPRRSELTPYVVTKNVSVPAATGYDRGERLDNVHTQFRNRWWLRAGATLGQLGST